MYLSTLCTIVVTFGTEIKVYAVNNSTFCGDTAKIGISRQISQNILDLSDFIGLVGVLVWMIILLFVWRSHKGRCYGNQLNLDNVDIARNELRRSTIDCPIVNPFSKD